MTGTTATTRGADDDRHAGRARRSPAILAAAMLVLAGGLAPAAATDLVAERLERLESDTARLAGMLGREAPVLVAQADPLPDTYAAEVEVRLSRLEEQVRALTGEIERIGFAASQLETQMTRTVNDIEFRLTVLEGGAPVAGGTPTGPPGQAPGAATTPTAPPTVPTGPTASTGPTAPADSAVDDGGIGPTYDTLTGDRTEDYGVGSLGTLTVPGEAGGAVAAPGGNVETAFRDAFSLLQRADYSAAEQALQGFLMAHPDHTLAGDAQYWLGETYYIQGRYNDAAIAFAQGYQRYAEGQRGADSLLKLGMSLAALGQNEDACLTFQQLDEAFPDAPVAVARRASQESARLGCP